MRRNLRFAAVYVALVAMLVHALIPVGWMPSQGGAAGVPIALCTMDGPARMVVDQSGRPVKQKPVQDDRHRHDICPFAAAPHFASPTTIASVAAPTAIDAIASLFVSSARPDLRPNYSSQAPRAPPVTV
ncbi:MAG TPA: DUF2946 family protein [Rhizomicrobium sp.]|jgi:hypothetical protein